MYKSISTCNFCQFTYSYPLDWWDFITESYIHCSTKNSKQCVIQYNKPPYNHSSFLTVRKLPWYELHVTHLYRLNCTNEDIDLQVFIFSDDTVPKIQCTSLMFWNPLMYNFEKQTWVKSVQALFVYNFEKHFIAGFMNCIIYDKCCEHDGSFALQ